MQLLSHYIPWIIVALREWIEAFLIVVILLRYLQKTNNQHLQKNVWQWLWAGIILSIWIGAILFWLGNILQANSSIVKIWESVISLFAVWLIISFVIWMIDHGKNIRHHIEHEAKTHLSSWWIIWITLLFIVREWAEISIFSYAGNYPLESIVIGIFLATILCIWVYICSYKIPLHTLLSVTLFYLIIQAGYLFGYSIHEWIGAMKELHIIQQNNVIFSKVFDLSKTLFDHKEWILWVPLNILFGWYSRPEWVQFIAQYLCTGWLLWIWWLRHRPYQHQ